LEFKKKTTPQTKKPSCALQLGFFYEMSFFDFIFSALERATKEHKF